MDIEWDKPYGIVFGDNTLGHFEQSGVYFDIHGKEVVHNSVKDIGWAKKQTGLGGRNLLMSYARDSGITVANNEKIGSVREKVIAHMS